MRGGEKGKGGGEGETHDRRGEMRRKKDVEKEEVKWQAGVHVVVGVVNH